MGQVIDIKTRLKMTNQQVENSLGSVMESDNLAPVVDISPVREEFIQNERRQNKRIILNGFIGAHIVVPGKGLLKVNIYDISPLGLAFETLDEAGHFNERDELAMRFYFNHQSYFPFTIKVHSIRFASSEGVWRHGAKFLVANGQNINETDDVGAAIHHFVEFLENVTKSLQKDSGDLKVSSMA